MESIKKITPLLLILIITLGIGSFYFITPWFGEINIIDEGQLAAWAYRMTAGQHLFKDIYITYGPLYVYPLYLVFKYVNQSFFALRFLYSVVFMLASLLIIYSFISKFKFRSIVNYILICIIALTAGAGLRVGVTFFVLYCISNINEKKPIWAFVSGISVVAAFLITPEAGMVGLTISFGYFFFSFINSKEIKVPLRNLYLFVCGLLLSFGLFTAWSAKEGWLSSYLENTIDILSLFSGSDLPNGKGLPNIIDLISTSSPSLIWLKYLLSKEALFYYQFIFYIGCLFYLFFKFVRESTNEKAKLFSITLLTAFLYYASLIGRAGNFFLSLTPTLILIAYFADLCLREKNVKNRLFAKLGIIMVLLFIMRLVHIYNTNLRMGQEIFGEFNNVEEIKNMGSIKVPIEQAEYIKAIQSYVSKNSAKNDYIFFLSNEPALYFFTERINPTRYDLPYIAHIPGKRYELLSDIQKRKPILIFYDRVSWSVDEISNKRRLPELMEYIHANYKKIYILKNRVEVYKINENKK